jgi:hypothetical protein
MLLELGSMTAYFMIEFVNFCSEIIYISTLSPFFLLFDVPNMTFLSDLTLFSSY